MDRSEEPTKSSAHETALPSPNTKRWVARRKALVVAAVRQGALSLDDACRRYALTVEEFLGWQSAIENYGLTGLRATRPRRRGRLILRGEPAGQTGDD